MNVREISRVAISLAGSSTLAAVLFMLLTGNAWIASAEADDLFVIPGGDGDCSQAAPCDLQTALSGATDGSTVYLAEGTYTGSGGAVVTVTQSITLYGGWDGSSTTPPVRDSDLHVTTIDGETARRGAYIVGPVTVTLEGLTIARGRAVSTTARGWDGAGLYGSDAALTLRDTAFYSNVVDVHEVDDSDAYGGGAAIQGGSLLVEASVFRWNSAQAKSSSYGGGLSIENARATVKACLFQENDTWHGSGLHFSGEHTTRTPLILSDSIFVDNGRGRSGGRGPGGYAGALKVQYAQARIEGNVFRRSRASNDYGAVQIRSSDLYFARNLITGTQCGRTSGLYLSSVSPFTATNNIIAANLSAYTSAQYPAVRVRGGSGRFIHNTVAQNDSAYGVRLESGATVTLTNTVLVSHTVGITVATGSTAALEGTLWGSGAWANDVDWEGDGDISTGTVDVWGNPVFVNPEGSDYHIGRGSAARDAGVNAGVIEDIDGDERPEGAGYDIGADEYTPRWDVFLPLVARD